MLAIDGLIRSPWHLIFLYVIRIHIVERLFAGRSPNVWHRPILQMISWHIRRVKRLAKREVIVRVPKRKPVFIQRINGIVKESRPVTVREWLKQGITSARIMPVAVPPTLRTVEILAILKRRPLATLMWQTPRQLSSREVLLSIFRYRTTAKRLREAIFIVLGLLRVLPVVVIVPVSAPPLVRVPRRVAMPLGTTFQQILAGSAAIGGCVVVEGVLEALRALDVFVDTIAFWVIR